MELLDTFAQLSALQIAMLGVSAMLIGMSKTGLPGIGILPVVLLVSAFDSRLSTGIQLVLLAAGDVMAVCYYRRKADWRILLKILPWALAGLAIGSLVLRFMPSESDKFFKRMIGLVILLLFILGYLRSRVAQDKIKGGVLYNGFFGTLSGVTTQLANAAGPVAALYLLPLKLSKECYMGCTAWFFLTLNWIKLPIFISEGRITLDSLKLDILAFPLVLVGAALGITILKKMSLKFFEQFIRIIVIIAALKLLFF